MILLLAAAFAIPEHTHDDLRDMDRWIRDAAKTWHAEAAYRSPTQPMREAALTGMTLLADAIDDCAQHELDLVATALEPAAMSLALHRTGDQRIVVVWDRDNRGAGWSMWRCGAADEVLVQAPHAFFDLQTGTIVRRAFLHGTARGATFNTVHRYRAHPDEVPEDELHPADSTRQPASMLHTVALAWMSHRPQLRAMQLHGFGAGTAPTDAVLSTGSAEVPPRRAQDTLAEVLDVKAAAYGDDLKRLGARTNVLGRALARTPGRFLHVELARDLRRRLASDRELAATLIGKLAEVPWDS